jgi:hypothetical protein
MREHAANTIAKHSCPGWRVDKLFNPDEERTTRCRSFDSRKATPRT